MRRPIMTAALCILSFSNAAPVGVVPADSEINVATSTKDATRLDSSAPVGVLASAAADPSQAPNSSIAVKTDEKNMMPVAPVLVFSAPGTDGVLSSFQPSDHFRSTLSFIPADETVASVQGAALASAFVPKIVETHVAKAEVPSAGIVRADLSGDHVLSPALAMPDAISAFAADEPTKPQDASVRAEDNGTAAQAIDGALAETADDVKTPRSRPRFSRDEVCNALTVAAQEHDLPVPFLTSLIWQESRFNSEAVSPVGAQGIAQFMPRIASAFGLSDPLDPRQALPISARMLRGLVDQFGNLGLAAAAYNAGSGRVEKWLNKRGKLPEETRNYVLRITGRTPEHWRARAKRHGVVQVTEVAPCPGVSSFTEALNATAKDAVTKVAAVATKVGAVLGHSNAKNEAPVAVASRADGKLHRKGGRETLVIAMQPKATVSKHLSGKDSKVAKNAAGNKTTVAKITAKVKPNSKRTRYAAAS
jgi:soluble lytic murein transglycosylase-like protein